MVAAQVLNRVTPSTSTISSDQNEWADRPFNDVICLFDVDGTLSLSRKVRKEKRSNQLPDLSCVDCHSRNDPIAQGIEEKVCNWGRWGIRSGQAKGTTG